jgi:hypothetical protein
MVTNNKSLILELQNSYSFLNFIITIVVVVGGINRISLPLLL